MFPVLKSSEDMLKSLVIIIGFKKTSGGIIMNYEVILLDADGT